AAPWAEWDWIGRTLRIGQAELRIEERITRCRATSANPETGRIDTDTLGGLDAAFGHQDFGLYAVVSRGGTIATGDTVTLT
ncbi:MAG: MOSC domain-containing protein, partial [Cereibacter sp.]